MVLSLSHSSINFSTAFLAKRTSSATANFMTSPASYDFFSLSGILMVIFVPLPSSLSRIKPYSSP